jgi:hypothetical protein
MNIVQDTQRPVVQVNPAKPPKRALPIDADDQDQRPAIQRSGPSFQQLDAKRRKTEDEEDVPPNQRKSTMAPPIRHSTIRKV